MLDKTDLSKRIDRETFEKQIALLYPKLGVLQRALWDRKVPIFIVVEGWNASGITMVISELIQYLDPRGFALHSIGSPNDEERARPLLWRFWIRTPARGRIAIFARSWYSRSLAELVSGIDWKTQIRRSVRDINTFERQHIDDGAAIIKIFLHISSEEQKRRLEERERNALTSWMITQGDWDFHSHYDDYLPLIEHYLKGTDTAYAPWTIIGATDGYYTRLKAYTAVIRQLEKRCRDLEKDNGDTRYEGTKKLPGARVKRTSVPPEIYEKPVYESALQEYQEEVRDTQYWLFKRKIPLIIVYEGWDAAGKGGNIMRLVHSMNPRGYDVVPISRPDQTEADHHYLWRFYRRFPAAGHTTIFDRSWYGRVLVERVEGFCRENEWKRAYAEINEMEQSYVEQGGGLVKFWLEISRDEQHRRFMARQNDVLKEWKMTDEDWRNRGKWREYDEAVDEMLARTSTRTAPWTVIESDDKYYARLKALQTVIEYGKHILR